MSNNDQQGTNKPGGKPGPGSKGPSRIGSKPAGKVQTKSVGADAADKKEDELKAMPVAIGRPKPKAASMNQVVTENGKTLNDVNQKSVPEFPKSEPDSYRVEHPASEITTMEVHHHPQLDHKHKPFKEYLLEGFMIFIAVMMGFIAENIRESIDNSDQAKHLTEQLVHDLKGDTAQLNYLYKGEALIVKYNDTLFNLLQKPLAKADIGGIQKQAANSHTMWPFHPSSGAMAAIKNQLHLKQFSNSDIINYFANYERHIELLHTDQDINLQYQRIYLEPFLTQHLTPANLIAAFDKSEHPTAQTRNLGQADLDQLATDMVLIRIVNKEMLKDNRSAKADAVALLQYVKKQYGVDGE